MSTLDIIATLRKALKLSDSAQLSVHPSGAVNHVYRLQNVALHYEGTERKLQFHTDSEKAFRHRQTGQVVEGEQNQGRDPKQSCCVGDFAVKWLGDDRFSGIDRTYQFALQKKLCRLGLAPQPIWLSDDETIWVEQWQSDTTNPSLTPQCLAQTLASVHQLQIKAHPLKLAARWQHYIDIAKLNTDSILYQKAGRLRPKVLQSEQADNDSVLCHNDLAVNHILIRRDNTLTVIDWEYAAMGNRYFDLASCALINKLDSMTSTELVKRYADIMRINQQIALAEFNLHKEIVSVTNDLWFAALKANDALI